MLLPDLPQEPVRLRLLGLSAGVDGRQIRARRAPRILLAGGVAYEVGYADEQIFAVRVDEVGFSDRDEDREIVNAGYVVVARPAVDAVVGLPVEGVDEVGAGSGELMGRRGRFSSGGRTGKGRVEVVIVGTRDAGRRN